MTQHVTSSATFLMNNDFFNSALSIFWSDINLQDDFPARRPLLAHYTSMSTLESILCGKQLWLSNPLYMNDLEELRFGMNVGSHRLLGDNRIRQECPSDESYAYLIDAFHRYYSEFNEAGALDTYVACFSEHDVAEDDDGSLSMWRGYGAGGSGAAIVLNTAAVQHSTPSPLMLSPVAYLTSDERMSWIDKSLQSVAALVRVAKNDTGMLEAIAYAWFQRLKMFALFTKHRGFREEREWRLVYLKDRDPSGVLSKMISYAVTHRGVEPKLKLQLEELANVLGVPVNLGLLVDRILLGPTASHALAIASAKRMLTLLNLPHLAEKVRASSIPFRN